LFCQPEKKKMMTGEHLGANYSGEGNCSFTVWAPYADKLEVHITSPGERLIDMEKDSWGYYHSTTSDVLPGTLYFLRLNSEKDRPDPASRFQPEGVHGPSCVVETGFDWQDADWKGIPLDRYIIYEIHTGTFTSEGTLTAIIPYLDYLLNLGITAIELMPVNQFPGERNWGYDGVYPYAVQHSYGGPEALKRLVNACHLKGLAVVLDVVHNHLGPEGNRVNDFGPYFTEKYSTPWGSALNFDGPHSDHVRRFFIESILYWMRDCHIDAFRLDAIHTILDSTPYTFIEQLSEEFHDSVKRLDRRAYLIGESSADNVRLIRPPELGGYGLDGQWNDDFHHSLHSLLTGDRQGYYQDYGEMKHLVKAFQEGFVYSGEYSLFRQRRHGTSSKDIPAERFTVFSQNHDQVGNRAKNDRLTRIVPFDALKLAAGIVILSPFVPLLFMGEEYGETAPFPFFVDHSDPDLIKAVREGRQKEFAAFKWEIEIPDPKDRATFLRAKLDHGLKNREPSTTLLAYYKELIKLRKTIPALFTLSKEGMEVSHGEDNNFLFTRRVDKNSEAIIFSCFNDKLTIVELTVPPGVWNRAIDSADDRWKGQGSKMPKQIQSNDEKLTFHLSPWQFILYIKE
jgi:maltooligosyltrehalose trehalohydrolase